MTAKATVADGPREPIDRSALRSAMVPLADLLGIDPADILGMRVGKTVVSAHIVTRAKRSRGAGRVYHYAVTRLSVPVIDDPEEEE